MPKKFIILVSIILLLTFSCPVAAQDYNLDLINEIKVLLWDYYIDPLPYRFLNEQTLDGLLALIDDPYTEYYTAEEFDNFLLSLEGQITGIGLTIEKQSDKQVVITKVIPTTPAAKANIKKGDIITHLEDKALEKLNMEEISRLFEGEQGTYLKINTYRPSEGTFRKLFLTREYIKIKPIESLMLTKEIGYLKITEFTEETPQEFSLHLNNLKKQKIKGLILDLRNNSGGLLGSVLDVSGELLPPGELVKLTFRDKRPQTITTLGNKKLLPLIVLVNKETASAAEILAGAIQDRNAGLVIGTTTYGKASIQSLIPLKNGGALKFTSSKYLTPNNRQIDKIGLNPDLFSNKPHTQVTSAIWMLENNALKNLIFQLDNSIFLINGYRKSLSAKPYLTRNHLMVPLLPLVESLGGKVKFLFPNSYQITWGKNNLKLKLNSLEFSYNNQTSLFPVAPVLRNNQIIIPLRIIAEAMGAKVLWEPNAKQVIIQ